MYKKTLFLINLWRILSISLLSLSWLPVQKANKKINKETKKLRNKETKKQRNKETKKQRNKDTKKQRNKETKKLRNKETKKQRKTKSLKAMSIYSVTWHFFFNFDIFLPLWSEMTHPID